MKETMEEQEKEYNELFESLNHQLHGKDLDNIIPALATLLAHAGAIACSDKKEFISFVVETIDERFEMERKQ